jgi:hypothetical protein
LGRALDHRKHILTSGPSPAKCPRLRGLLTCTSVAHWGHSRVEYHIVRKASTEDFSEDEKSTVRRLSLRVPWPMSQCPELCSSLCSNSSDFRSYKTNCKKDYPRNRITPSDQRISEGEITSTERQPDIASFVGWCILNLKKRRQFCVSRCSFYVLASSPSSHAG